MFLFQGDEAASGSGSGAKRNRGSSVSPAREMFKRVSFAVMGRKPKVIENWTDEQVIYPS